MFRIFGDKLSVVKSNAISKRKIIEEKIF